MKNHHKKRLTRAQKIEAARVAADRPKLVGVDFAKLEANPAVRTAKAAPAAKGMRIEP